VTAVDIALPRLQTEEGFRAVPYKDTNGNTTLGYGFNVDAGISKIAAAALLLASLNELQGYLLALAWYAALDPVRQSVCLDIAFNQGIMGLLRYPHMVAALARQDWMSASLECHVADPKLAARYAELAALLLNGGASQ
jgi:lysozyme